MIYLLHEAAHTGSFNGARILPKQGEHRLLGETPICILEIWAQRFERFLVLPRRSSLRNEVSPNGVHTETPLDSILDHVGRLKTTLWSGAPVSNVGDLFPELCNCEVILLQVKAKLWSLRLLLSTGCAVCLRLTHPG